MLHGEKTADDSRVTPLQPGVRLTAIFDSCHSGSALDLPYIYSTQGVLKEPNLAKEAGQGLLGIVGSYAKGDIGGMLSTATGLFKKATTGGDTREKNLRTKTSSADVIMWSGSKDSQTSYVDTSTSGYHTWLMHVMMTGKTQTSRAKLQEPCHGRLLRPSRRTPSRATSSCSIVFVMSSRPSTRKSRNSAAVILLVCSLLPLRQLNNANL